MVSHEMQEGNGGKVGNSDSDNNSLNGSFEEPGSIQVPETVRTNIQRHANDLSRLAKNLKQLGMDEKTINKHVLGLFAQYERALEDSVLEIETESKGWNSLSRANKKE